MESSPTSSSRPTRPSPSSAAAPTFLELLQRFAATLAASYDINAVLYELGLDVVETLGADGAGVSVASRADRLEFVTTTNQDLIGVEQVQERTQAGPCVESFRRSEIVVVSDLAAVTDWPEYREAAESAGYCSVIGVPLRGADRSLGSLNVYSRAPRDYGADELGVAQTLADMAAAYLLRAGELADARELATQLQHALDSRIVIEQAKGVVSRSHGITVDEAFELLRGHARRSNLRLRSLAQDVVDGRGGSLPGLPTGDRETPPRRR